MDRIGLDPDASMRPQHITAENGSAIITSPPPGDSFNEAAAYHCGKHGCLRKLIKRIQGFNEAAAYHCGKRALAGNV